MERNVPFNFFLVSLCLVPLNLHMMLTAEGALFSLVVTVIIYILWYIGLKFYYREGKSIGIRCIKMSLINLMFLLVYYANEYGRYLFNDQGNSVEEIFGTFVFKGMSMPFAGLQILAGYETSSVLLGCAIAEILILIAYLNEKEYRSE